MRNGERHEVVVAPLQHVAGTELRELHGVRERPEDALQHREEALQPRRAVDVERHVAPAKARRSSSSPAGPGSGRRGSASGRSREARSARLPSAGAVAASPRRSRRGGVRRPAARAVAVGARGRSASSRTCRGRGRPDPWIDSISGPLPVRLAARWPNQVQGGRLAARAIAAEGVDTIFTLCGGHVMPIYEGCRLEGVRVVDVRHEQAAAPRCRGVGTGHPRVRRRRRYRRAGRDRRRHRGRQLLCRPDAARRDRRREARSSRPGRVRFRSSTSARSSRRSRNGRPCARRPERIPDHVATAFRHALAQPRGPVYLELPMDVLFAEACGRPSRRRARLPGRSAIRASSMKAADLLTNAERPAVDRREAGSGGTAPGSSSHAFAESGPLPVFLNGRAAARCRPIIRFSSSTPRGTATRRQRTSSASSGRRSISDSSSAVFPPATKLVHIHADPTELGRNRAPDAGDRRRLRRGPRHPRRRGRSPRRTATAWLSAPRGRAAWWAEHRVGDRVRRCPASPLPARRRARPRARSGHDRDRRRRRRRRGGLARAPRPPAGHWLDPGPFGCLGVGPPYALGVKAAQARTRQVVVVAGDGAFGLNGFEFETLTGSGCPAVFVIGNDAAWGEIRIPQVGLYGDDAEVATRLAPTPYQRLTRRVRRPRRARRAARGARAGTRARSGCGRARRS